MSYNSLCSARIPGQAIPLDSVVVARVLAGGIPYKSPALLLPGAVCEFYFVSEGRILIGTGVVIIIIFIPRLMLFVMLNREGEILAFQSDGHPALLYRSSLYFGWLDWIRIVVCIARKGV